MRPSAWAGVTLASLVTIANPAAAYHGGRQVAEVIGYAPAEHAVYFVVRDESEIGLAPALYVIDLEHRPPPRVTRLTRALYLGDDPDEAVEARVTTLRQHLVPLTADSSLVPRITVHSTRMTDTLRDAAGEARVARFRFDARFLLGDREGRLRGNSVCDDTVRHVLSYPLEAEHATISVVAYVGGQAEYCDEVETCVALRAPARARVRERPR